jgi:hypothetical protein
MVLPVIYKYSTSNEAVLPLFFSIQGGDLVHFVLAYCVAARQYRGKRYNWVERRTTLVSMIPVCIIPAPPCWYVRMSDYSTGTNARGISV